LRPIFRPANQFVFNEASSGVKLHVNICPETALVDCYPDFIGDLASSPYPEQGDGTTIRQGPVGAYQGKRVSIVETVADAAHQSRIVY
jgi:hypothetical protein